MKEVKEKYQNLLSEIEGALETLDLDRDKKRLKTLDLESQDTGFWNDADSAKEKMQEIATLRNNIELWESLYTETRDGLDLADITEENEHDILDSLEAQIIELSQRYKKLEAQLFLGGQYDKNNAVLSIFSGAGGTDSQDWAEMLLRMYLRYAEKNNFITKIINITPGEEAGIKNVTVEISGLFAYGFLKNEKGVHRLVRLSPFDSDHARHTSFALVEAFPELEDTDFSLDEKDLRIETFRASGHGGQSVNTTDSAVRITHIPTGLVSSCQNERSQLQNKAFAMKMLISKLKLQKEEEEKKEREEIRGENISVEWGNQIRSYVLHPYNMVKDLRTGHETSNTQAVLDGDIADFIDANLKKMAGR